MNDALKLNSLLAAVILTCAACPSSGGGEDSDTGIDENGGPDASARDSGAVVSKAPDAALSAGAVVDGGASTVIDGRAV